MLKVSAGTSSRSTYDMNVTGWSRGLEVTGGGTGIVSHAGLALLRQLSDRTGLTSGLSAALPSPLGGHDRRRGLSHLASATPHRAPPTLHFPALPAPPHPFRP